MSITVIGNHSRGYLGHGIRGNGVQNVPVGIGWCSITASEAGETHVFQLGSVLIGDLNQGSFFQSENGASAQFTLCNPGMSTSLDPNENGSTLWGNTLAIPAGGQIIKSDLVYTACKITFTAPGTVYVGTR